VQGSSLISQIFSPKVPSTTDDGYSSPKSEKETDDEDNDDHGLKTSDYQHSDSKKPSMQCHLYKVQQCEIFIFKCVYLISRILHILLFLMVVDERTELMGGIMCNSF